jgi:hypothetical protein
MSLVPAIRGGIKLDHPVIRWTMIALAHVANLNAAGSTILLVAGECSCSEADRIPLAILGQTFAALGVA